MGRRPRADAGTPRPLKPLRCKSCGRHIDCTFRGFCSDECRETGADLMPEEIEGLLEMRALLRKVGVLPRLELQDLELTSHRLTREPARLHGINRTGWKGAGSIAAAAIEYKKGEI